MNQWETPALTGYSCGDSHPEPTKAIYYWEKKKSGQISDKVIRFKFVKKTGMPNSVKGFGYIKC